MGNVGLAKKAANNVMSEIEEESKIEVDPENSSINSISLAKK